MALAAGGESALVTEDGIKSADWRFLLAAGRRDPQAVLDGAVFFDPTSTDTILIEPMPDGDCLLRQGTIDIAELLGKSKDPRERLMAGCVESLDAAYDQCRQEVSSWLIQAALAGVMRVLERDGDSALNVDFEALIEPRVDMVWSALAQRGCVQPWAGGP